MGLPVAGGPMPYFIRNERRRRRDKMRSKAPALRDRRFRITLEDLNGWAFIAVAMAVFIDRKRVV